MPKLSAGFKRDMLVLQFAVEEMKMLPSGNAQQGQPQGGEQLPQTDFDEDEIPF